MALFCDFENVALGVRDANFDKFDIKPILERLLLKGPIVVKKAYCDWDRYKTFKAAMHEANFELIEIPHVRQSGKNSADIRLVVDALDLCYTKAHVNTFVIISGDSDFSPLVSKLRENAKQVIGVGVRQSTSDLLIANCDEFIFYDDLVRETRQVEAKREKNGKTQTGSKRATPDENNRNREEQEARKSEAIEMAIETFDALISERGDSGKIWASVLKNAIKRRKPDFNEGNYGFRTFGALLEEAQARGQLQLSRDDKSGTYVYRSAGAGVTAPVANETAGEAVGGVANSVTSNVADASASVQTAPAIPAVPATKPTRREDPRNARRNERGNRNAPRPELPPTGEQSAASAETASQDVASTSDNTLIAAGETVAAAAIPESAAPTDSVTNHDHVAAVASTDTEAQAAEPSAAAKPVRHERGRRTQTGRRPVKSQARQKTDSTETAFQVQPDQPAPTTPTAPAAPAEMPPVTTTTPADAAASGSAASPAKKRPARPKQVRKPKDKPEPAQ
jgi:uncharacterized LabA/DUF88 family protein